LERIRHFSDLVDPRPQDGDRSCYQGMVLLPVSYECDWMASNRALQRSIGEQMLVIGSEQEILRIIDDPGLFGG
jgi:hypothetical protein